MREETTDLEKLKTGVKFTWGELIQIHHIGEYDIVEYYNLKRDGVRVTNSIDYDSISFHGYLNGISTSHSYLSLDAALVGLVARKHDGHNSHAGYYFMKMIAKDDE